MRQYFSILFVIITGVFEIAFSFESIAQTSPELSVTSSNALHLYKNCANIISIADGTKSVLTAKSDQAKVTHSVENPNKFLVVPNTTESCTVRVANQSTPDKELGSINFQVTEPPKPSLALYVGGEAITAKRLIKRGEELKLKIIPDPNFKFAQPVDARYLIGKLSVYLLCKNLKESPKLVGGAMLESQDGVSGIPLAIPQDAWDCEGAILYFTLESIQRKNFEGKLFTDERFTETEKTLMIQLE